MSVLFIVLPLAVLMAMIAVIAFIWGVRTGQFDDLSTPGVRMLHDDDEPGRKENQKRETQNAKQEKTDS